MKRLIGIYKIINLINNKIYIGYSSNLNRRKNQHFSDLRNGLHKNDYLQKSWFKYNESNFKYEIIEYCKYEELSLREHYWVNFYQSFKRDIGYNLKPTDPNNKSKHSIETIEKIRNAHKGKSPSLQCIEARKLVGMTDEHKEILYESRKKLDLKKIQREKRGKKIIDISNGIIYNSLIELSEKTNIPKYELSRRLTGKRKNNTSYKYL